VKVFIRCHDDEDDGERRPDRILITILYMIRSPSPLSLYVSDRENKHGAYKKKNRRENTCLERPIRKGSRHRNRFKKYLEREKEHKSVKKKGWKRPGKRLKYIETRLRQMTKKEKQIKNVYEKKEKKVDRLRTYAQDERKD
jgi:hypothetical protein